MIGKEVLFHINLRVSETGGKAQAEIVTLTPQTVSVRIDPNTAWDSDALRQLSAALDVVAKTLPFQESER